MMRHFLLTLLATLASIFVAAAKDASYSPEQLQRILSSAQTIDPVQPPAELVAKIERAVTEQSSNTVSIRQFSPKEFPQNTLNVPNVLMQNDIPYFKYNAQRNAESYIVHPMDMGTLLLRNASGTAITNVAKEVLGLAHTLPNGGLAWYYPRHYRVSRMLSHHLKYSAISQGSLLAGFEAVAKQTGAPEFHVADRILAALDWPFEKGGVNLNDRAVLEMPSFAGPPEIILNGWIDTLLHLREYGVSRNNERALEVFRRNIAFMSNILSSFDAPDAQISRYSDVSPYRATITVDRTESLESLQLLYIPKVSGLSPVLVPLKKTHDPSQISQYENQILSQKGATATVWLSCSQHYDTVILAKSGSLRVEMKKGELDRLASTPGVTGTDIQLTSSKSYKDQSYVTLGVEDGLICGYPTNFSKGKNTNFYHVFHVVGLLLLSMGEHVTDAQRAVLIQWALKWYDDMGKPMQPSLEFYPPETLFAALQPPSGVTAFPSFSAIVEAARKKLKATSAN